MFLALDVGNSHITLGLYDRGAWTHVWRWTTAVETTADEYGVKLAQWFRYLNVPPQALQGAGMVSVVPTLTENLAQALRRYLDVDPFVLQRTDAHRDLLRMEVQYNWQQIGLDRVVNAVAALYHYAQDAPLCVVDIGTAVTIDVVLPEGRFLGGVIAPGPGTMLRGLHTGTAVLPYVQLEVNEATAPLSPLAQNTQEAIRGGVLFALAGLLRYTVHQVAAYFRRVPFVVATGGWSQSLADWLLAENLVSHVDPHLTLEGVRLLWARAQQPSP